MLTCHWLVAQEIKINAGFVQDSMRLGQPFDYWVVVEYPFALEVFLPDSTYDFSPYLLHRKTFTETQVIDSLAKDSVGYTLKSFEIAPWQSFRLPVFLRKAGDSTTLFTPTDSIAFQAMVAHVSDTTALRSNTNFVPLKQMFNTPMFLIISGSVLFILIALLLIFRKQILRHWQIRKVKGRQRAFDLEMDEAVKNLKDRPQIMLAERQLARWKGHLEFLTQVPYARMTTHEILNLKKTQSLALPLKNIDRSIYGGMENEKLYQDFQSLSAFAETQYNNRLEAIKKGYNEKG